MTREELDAQILRPWASGQSVEWGERRWSPEKAKLTVYEGPELRPDEIGLGRGWQNATRTGDDVTARVLAASNQPSPKEEALADVKQRLLERCRELGTVPVREGMIFASELQPDWRGSDRLAVAEQAVWELLHLGSVRLVRAGDAGMAVVERDEWQSLLLDWDTWAGPCAPEFLIELSAE